MKLWMQVVVVVALGVFTALSLAGQSLVLPEGHYEGRIISSEKLERSIVEELDEVIEVRDISFSSELYFIELSGIIWTAGKRSADIFTTTFTIKAVSGDVYYGIACRTTSTYTHLWLQNCESSQVKLTKPIGIEFVSILEGRYQRYNGQVVVWEFLIYLAHLPSVFDLHFDFSLSLKER